MPKSASKSKDAKTIIALPDRLMGESVDNLLAEMQQAATSPMPLELEAGAVSVIDTTAIQILLAAAAQNKAAGQPFSLTSESPAFTEAFQCLGLDQQLSDWRSH